MIKINFNILLLLLLTALFFSCKKDHGVLGVEVQPGEDGLNADFAGDIPVYAHSSPYDSIVSYNDAWKYIGSNNDPDFGQTDVGIYFKTYLSATNIDFGSDSKYISGEIILVLDNDWVGDKTASLTFSVFPLDSVLYPAPRVYYTSNNRLHNKTMISAYTCTYTSMLIPGSSSSVLVPVLRIKLDSNYMKSLMFDTQNLVDNDTYQAKYKGYYIAASIAGGGEGAIFKANLDNDYSGLHLFYTTAAVPEDTIDFNFKTKGALNSRFNTVKFNYSQNLKDQFQDSTLGSSALYLKGLGGTRLKVQIPFLQNYSDSFQVSVNRAELIFNIDQSFTALGNYTKPPRLTLLSMDTIGRETYLQDLKSTTDNIRYDGYYDESNKRYVFNLAREAQLIFRGQKKNRGFYLVVSNVQTAFNFGYDTGGNILLPVRRDDYVERVIFAGASNATLKPKFNLFYVKFKND